MNAYLSREEKEKFIRLALLTQLLDDAIDGYVGVKSTDASFLKYLRMGRTMVEKALTMRTDALDENDKAKFHSQVNRLEVKFLLTPEAIKADKELLAHTSTLPIDAQDFEDWYSEVIETTCKTCHRADYSECLARRVQMKYGFCPIDPEAKNKCQYSYVGTPEAEDLKEATSEYVPAEVYNAALAVAKAKEDSINENYLPMIKQLETKLEQLRADYEKKLAAVKETAQAESQPEPEQGITVTIGLRDGVNMDLRMSEYWPLIC